MIKVSSKHSSHTESRRAQLAMDDPTGCALNTALCDSPHDGVEVLRSHGSLGVRQPADDVREQVVDGIVLTQNAMV